MKSKLIITLLSISLISSMFAGCGQSSTTVPETTVQEETTTQDAPSADDPLYFDVDANYTVETITVDGVDITYRSYENILYVSNPVDEEAEIMNIYIPDSYFTGENIGEFTIDTAPIFFPNSVGQYLPSSPATPSLEGAVSAEASRAGLTGDGGNTSEEGEGSPNATLYALMQGYIVAAPGSRGRTSESEDGTYTGKAPAGLVDLKAAVSYLHYNDAIMPGDANKIISNGTSAGGAMSALLGATGDNPDYDSYLDEIGAADASNAIYAVSAYCPITNLDNADMAYEWMFNGINDYTMMNITMVDGELQRERVSGTLTDEQIEYSNELSSSFIDYVNSLGLLDENGNVLTLNEDGTGSFETYLENYIKSSAQSALDAGEDLSSYDWITIENNTVTAIDFEGYKEHIGRMKATMAFDAVDSSNPENSEFGTETEESLHFTEYAASKDASGTGMADSEIIKLMNPMNYIGTEDTTVAQYWRIRHGSQDSDTAFPVPTLLALSLENAGAEVDFAIPWGQGHGGDYDIEELFDWIDSIL